MSQPPRSNRPVSWLTPGRLGGLVGAVAAVLVLGPAWRPGYLLFYDMVFVPRLPLTTHTMGVDGSVPRAVPNDLVVALLSTVAPGWVVQKLLLAAVFVVVGAGAGALMRSRSAAAGAAVLAVWNPWVGERLAIGHWGFLLGYACLPWLARAAGHYRRRGHWGRTRLLAWMLLVALSGSTGSVLGLLVVLAVLLVPGRSATGSRSAEVAPDWRGAGVAAGFFAVANAAWWYPFLVLAPRESGDPAGVAAFMSRADTPWGVIASVATGGGIWNKGVWFADRSSVISSGIALTMVLVAVLAAVRTRWWRGVPESGIVVAGVLGLLIAVASALPGGRQLVTAIVTDVPGGGLLRDSQKFAATWVLALAVGSGRLTQSVWLVGRRLGVAGLVRLGVSALVAVWPVATFAGLAWGAGGKWQAVRYPTAYTKLAARIDAAPAGTVAVFPWTFYRRYSWDHQVVVLDPWQRLLRRPVLVNDDLPLSSQVVRGENTDARRITDAVRSGGDVLAALRAAHVRYVVLQTDQPTAGGMPPAGLRLLGQEPGLRWYEVPGASAAAAPTVSPSAYAGLALLACAAGTVLVSAVVERRGPRK